MACQIKTYLDLPKLNTFIAYMSAFFIYLSFAIENSEFSDENFKFTN